MAFLDKVFGDEKENKLKQEIKGLEIRKESAFMAINNEIQGLENQKRELLLTAGTRMYDAWVEKKEDEVNTEEYWNKVQELEKQVVEQETKRREMGDRYNEEIKLLKDTLEAMKNANANPAVADVLKCPKCNGVVNKGDLFCQSCGNKLQ